MVCSCMCSVCVHLFPVLCSYYVVNLCLINILLTCMQGRGKGFERDLLAIVAGGEEVAKSVRAIILLLLFVVVRCRCVRVVVFY